MPASIKARPGAVSACTSARPTSHKKFSGKLTASLHDITRMVNEHKGMIDAIQELALESPTSIQTLHMLTVQYTLPLPTIFSTISFRSLTACRSRPGTS